MNKNLLNSIASVISDSCPNCPCGKHCGVATDEECMDRILNWLNSEECVDTIGNLVKFALDNRKV